MKFNVKAVSLNVETGEPTAPARTELIDTAANVLFRGCDDETSVEDKYEAFWNRINGFTNDFPHGKVKVLTVEKVYS